MTGRLGVSPVGAQRNVRVPGGGSQTDRWKGRLFKAVLMTGARVAEDLHARGF